ncbi:MAG: response regulator [Geitlerinemataceae cyanobacterium]
MQPEQQRILGYFIEEAADHLQTIERGLLNLQATIDDAEFANEIFRAAHSVKGGAAMLGLSSIQTMSHRLEDYFKILKDRPIVVDREVESNFLRVFDALQGQVGELQRTGDPGSLDEGSVAELDPVFAELKSQLDRLAQQPEQQLEEDTDRTDATFMVAPEVPSVRPTTLPLSQPSEEQSALQLIFHTDVLARLREILQLFQQPETLETRKQICEICRVLAKVGIQFELPQWRHLLDVTHEAVSQESNSFGELATVAIKELKQAQELVLAGRESEIAVSESLQALLPLEPVRDDATDGAFDDLFGDADGLDDLGDLGGAGDAGDAIGAGEDDDLGGDDLFGDLDLDGGEAAALETAPSDSDKSRNGPEVGAVELNSLADLFEADLSDLDSWDNLEGNPTAADNPLGDPDADDLGSEFADLFASDDAPAEPVSESDGDDLDSLFDGISDGDGDENGFDLAQFTEAQQSIETDDGAEANGELDGDFDDLFDLDGPAEAALGRDSGGGAGDAPENGSGDELDFLLEENSPDAPADRAIDPAIDGIDLSLEGELLGLDPDLPADPLAEELAADGLGDLEALFGGAGIDASPAARPAPGPAPKDGFDDLFAMDDAPGLTPAAIPSEPDFDDLDLFDRDIGEAETFAPPQTTPPIESGDDLSLDGLFDDLDGGAANGAADGAVSDADGDFGDLFGDAGGGSENGLGAGLDELDAELDLGLGDGLGAGFDSVGELPDEPDVLDFDAAFGDDLDLSEALADVSLEGEALADLASFDNAPIEVVDPDVDLSLFPHLGILLNSPEPEAGTAVFDALARYLDREPVVSAPAPTASAASPVSKAAIADEFADLEHLLELDASPESAPKAAPAAARPARRQRSRGSAFEQTMRVPIKQLDDLSNLVGELVVNRNSLENDQERLRQFLDNLLHQVSQLSEVGQRMQDLYERTLLEMALLASRKTRATLASGGSVPNTTLDDSDEDYDALEMDKFSLFHTQAQEIIELVVRVRESSSDIEFLVDENDQVTRQLRQVTTQLQEGLNRSRMVPFSNAADRLPRGVRDNAIKFGKQVDLQIEGREMLIDRMILEQLYDPLTHLVNNAIAHGVETPEERTSKGKPAQGKITVSSFNQGNQTIIAIADDGAGIDKERVRTKALQKGLVSKEQADAMTDPEIYDLLFLPGFSTRDRADDLAGRGVGMDVVKTKLNDIRGAIVTDSTRDKGTTFTIRLPLTLSISKALCCVSDRAPIAFPMDGVSEVLDNLPRERIIHEGEGEEAMAYVQWREQKVPYQPLSDLFDYSRLSSRSQMYGSSSEDDTISVVILRSAGSQLAISVDSIIGEQEIVIKQLSGPIPKPMGITGATVMGDGHIVPIADVLELIDLSLGRVRRDTSSLWDETEEATVVQTEKAEPMVLIVDDSITVRELLSMTFKKSGYRVEQARDGQEAWEKMRSGMPCELVFCDMEMPRMNGMELLEKMSNDERLSELPIAMLTSRTAEKMKRRAGELGAMGYFTKPYLEEVLLDAAQRMLAGENMMAASGEPAPAS